MTVRAAADVVVAMTLVILVAALLGATHDLAAQRDRARADCEARNASERAMRAYHEARAAYLEASKLDEVAVFERRYLATVEPLPECE